ncbi:44095_t:CDS:2 [Gigaspora margarita]|uniref:44095_t:CDS:1 n=1 Tax=Gigaspora margarita TaxID=4874 RepID=A0ABN7W3T4_GIGMA|nr:44095_t:CDS:2 [Gigaspora margarita]
MSNFFLQEPNYLHEELDKLHNSLYDFSQEFNNLLQEFNDFSQELDFLQEFNNSLQKSDNFLQEFDLQKESNISLQELDLQKEFDNSLQELDLQRSNNYSQELGDYPKDCIILYKEKNRLFTYRIIKEGIYPLASTFKYISAPNRYEIPDNYIHLNNKPVLESIRYLVKRHAYEVSYGAKDPKKLKQKEKLAISEKRKQITQNIAKLVPISIIDIQTQAQVDPIEEPNITKIDIVENIVYIRISENGCNVGHKVKHVLIIFAILDDLANIHKPKHHYTIVLYSCAEDYYSLKNLTKLLNNELHELSNNGIVVNNTKWKCTISKKEHSNLNQEWTIEKNIEALKINLNTYSGHRQYPLFDIIPLDYWIVNELHLMLHITDWLWDLVLTEIKAIRLFNDTTREIIEQEMNKIVIHFQFWKDYNTNNLLNTSLIDDDKIKVLCEFNLYKIFPRLYTKLIREL